MLVRDLSGKTLFVVEGDVARDTSGKVVATRSGDDKQAHSLSSAAARRMSSERKVLMDLAPGDAMTPSTKAQYRMPSGDYVADVASEVRYVKNDRGVWYVENVTDAIRIMDPVASATGAPAELNPSYGKTAFTTTAYALAAKLPRNVSQNADWDLKLDAASFLIEALKRQRENRVATLLTKASNWATANQIAVGHKWNDVATAAPLTDLFAALAASYLPANRLVIPESVAPYFYASAVTSGVTLVRDFVQSGGELPDRLIARGKFSNAGAPAYIWAPAAPTNVALIRAKDPTYPPGTDEADPRIPTSVTFRWLGEDGVRDGERVDGMLVRTFFDPRDQSDWVVVAHNDVEVMVSNQVGALLVGAIQ